MYNTIVTDSIFTNPKISDMLSVIFISIYYNIMKLLIRLIYIHYTINLYNTLVIIIIMF